MPLNLIKNCCVGIKGLIIKNQISDFQVRWVSHPWLLYFLNAIEVCVTFSWLFSSIISFSKYKIWFAYFDLMCCVLFWIKSWMNMIRYMNMNMLCLFLCCSWIIWDSMHDIFLFFYYLWYLGFSLGFIVFVLEAC